MDYGEKSRPSNAKSTLGEPLSARIAELVDRAGSVRNRLEKVADHAVGSRAEADGALKEVSQPTLHGQVDELSRLLDKIDQEIQRLETGL